MRKSVCRLPADAQWIGKSAVVVCTYEQEEVGHLGEPKAKCALKVFVCLFVCLVFLFSLHGAYLNVYLGLCNCAIVTTIPLSFKLDLCMNKLHQLQVAMQAFLIVTCLQADWEDVAQCHQHGVLQLPWLCREWRQFPENCGRHDSPVRGRGLRHEAGNG